MTKSNVGEIVLASITSLEAFSEAFNPKVTKVKTTKESMLLTVLGINFGYEGFTVTRTAEGFRATVARENYRQNPRYAQEFMNVVADRCRVRYGKRMTVTRDGFIVVKL